MFRILISSFIAFAIFSQANAQIPCKDGFVWREASPSDYVCVTPSSRSKVQAENLKADSRRSSPTSATDKTCKSGYVWREAFPKDYVCVTPQRRAAVKKENKLSEQRQVEIQPAILPGAGNTGQIDTNTPLTNATVRLEFPGGPCSGTLVSPSHVLTAGHCFSNRPNPGTDVFSPQNWETPGEWYPLPNQINVRVGSNDRTAGQVFTSQFFSTPGHVDLLMLRLNSPVPGNLARPAEVVTLGGPTSSESTIRGWFSGKEIRIVGWGDIDPSPTTTFPRFRRLTPNATFTNYPVTAFDIINYAQYGLSSTDGSSTGGGDSGGPAYWVDRGRLKLVGVTQGTGRHVATFFDGTGTRLFFDGTVRLGLPDIGVWIDDMIGKDRCRDNLRPQDMYVEQARDGGWRIAKPFRGGGSAYLFSFQSRAAAEEALSILRFYGFTRECYDTLPNPNFSYLLIGSTLPIPDMPNESCNAINSSNLEIRRVNRRRWEIFSDDQSIGFTFEDPSGPGSDPDRGASAQASYTRAHYVRSIIQRRNATELCRLRTEPTNRFSYLKR